MTGINPEVTGKKPAQAPSKRLALKAGINPEITGKKAAHKRRRLMFRKDLMEFFKCSSPTIWNWMRLRNLPRPLVVEGRDAWWEHEILAWVESKPRRRVKGDPATNDNATKDNEEETPRNAAGD
jgi:predicted DNA-binding transcriptional regulator AlpA